MPVRLYPLSILESSCYFAEFLISIFKYHYRYVIDYLTNEVDASALC
jgi:hypothetical protein